MKALRVWMLMLLTLLLPLRGAVAAAMPCASMGMGVVSASASALTLSHGHQHGPAQTAHQHQQHAHDHIHEHGSQGQADDAQAGMDRCSVCSAGCGATPLPVGEFRLPDLTKVASTAFAAGPLRVVSFIADGQDRPPRTV